MIKFSANGDIQFKDNFNNLEIKEEFKNCSDYEVDVEGEEMPSFGYDLAKNSFIFDIEVNNENLFAEFEINRPTFVNKIVFKHKCGRFTAFSQITPETIPEDVGKFGGYTEKTDSITRKSELGATDKEIADMGMLVLTDENNNELLPNLFNVKDYKQYDSLSALFPFQLTRYLPKLNSSGDLEWKLNQKIKLNTGKYRIWHSYRLAIYHHQPHIPFNNFSRFDRYIPIPENQIVDGIVKYKMYIYEAKEPKSDISGEDIQEEIQYKSCNLDAKTKDKDFFSNSKIYCIEDSDSICISKQQIDKLHKFSKN